MKKCQGAMRYLGYGMNVRRNKREEDGNGGEYKGSPTRRSGVK